MWCEFGRRREDEVIFGACCGPWRAIACGWGGGDRPVRGGRGRRGTHFGLKGLVDQRQW